MIIAGIVLLAIGSFGVGAAVIMEVWKGDDIYKIMMKIFPWIFGVGGIILGVGLAIS